MKEIFLTQGKVAIVDDSDYDWLSQWNWYYNANGNGSGYAARGGSRGEPSRVYMHNAILGIAGGVLADHINLNRLDNRRENLRSATPTQNNANKTKQRGAYTSQYKGVVWYKASSRWHARIGFNNAYHHLGYFDSEIEAAEAYNQAAAKLFCDHARLNETAS